MRWIPLISSGHFIQMQKNTSFLKCTWNILRIDHILGNKSDLSEFKKTEIISSIFSDHNAMRLDINYKKKTVRNTNTWRLNNTFLNNQRYWKNQKGNQKISRNKWQWNNNSKPMGCSNSSSKREIYSNTILPQETRKT